MSPLPSPSSSPTCSINNSDLEDYIDVENKVVSDNVLSGEKRTDTSATATGVDSTDEGSTNEGSTEKDSTHENSTHENSPDENSPDEKDASESEEYQGTMVKPLSYFGSFEIDPPILELKWISDHTSGNVHKDMATISMLYNQDLTLPETAQNFIEQSPELLEEARWERLKAAFYGFYPNNIQDQAYAFLSGLSALEASRIIAKKTSRMEHEAILKPLSGGSSDYEDAKRLNAEIKGMIETAKRAATAEVQALQKSKKALKEEDSFDLDGGIYSLEEIKSESESWTKNIREHKANTKRAVEAQLFLLQLEAAKARFDPRTGFIHVKTSPVYPEVNNKDSLFSQASRIFATDEDASKDNCEDTKHQINCQFQRFEFWLQKFGTGAFGKFDAMHNNDLFQVYEFNAPYDSVSPKMCAALLNRAFTQPSYTWIIVSKSDISGYPKEYHVIRVYFSTQKIPRFIKCGLEATLQKCDYQFCWNCFETDHRLGTCKLPRYGFGYS